MHRVAMKSSEKQARPREPFQKTGILGFIDHDYAGGIEVVERTVSRFRLV